MALEIETCFSEARPRVDAENIHTNEQIIVPSVKKAASCFRPLCTACRLARAHRNLTHLSPRHPAPDMLIRAHDLLPGDCASVDQYVCHTGGRLPNTKGKEKDQKRFCGGLITVDHASGFIHLTHQVSLYGGETLRAKHSFEHLARGFGFSIKNYHCDNGIFAKDVWRHDCHDQHQDLDFSAVGAHHQNGVAERAIQTIANWSRRMMLHAALHWPDQADVKLWPFAMKHAVHIWNHLPDE